jgi:quinol monooxygenase YgiN
MSAVERRRGTKAGKTHRAKPDPLGDSEITPARPLVSSSPEPQTSRLLRVAFVARFSRGPFFRSRHLLQKGAPMTSTIALVRHRVADFDAWEKVYDGFAPIQAEHGVQNYQALRSIDNPDKLIVTHTFDSHEAARAFFAMHELKETMSQAGVSPESVEISYFDEVETGALVGA